MIQLLSLIFDSGLLVLIWLVELVIYPSFTFFPQTTFKKWHRVYVKRLSYVVIPLMSGQLGTSLYLSVLSFDALWAVKLLLILGAWALTFSIFVPLHNAVAQHSGTHNIAVKLVKHNRWRTLLWTLAFILGCYRFF